jgi:hypothetical protein
MIAKSVVGDRVVGESFVGNNGSLSRELASGESLKKFFNTTEAGVVIERRLREVVDLLGISLSEQVSETGTCESTNGEHLRIRTGECEKKLTLNSGSGRVWSSRRIYDCCRSEFLGSGKSSLLVLERRSHVVDEILSGSDQLSEFTLRCVVILGTEDCLEF